MLQQAWTHHQAGRLSQAENLYRQILQERPDHPEALQYLGMLAHQLGKSEIAVELMRRAIASKPDYVEAYYNLGLVFLMLGRKEEAIEVYHRALALKPDYVEAYNNLGNALLGLGRAAEAAANYRRALELRPAYVEAHYNLGKALQSLGETEEAIASCRRAIELKPDYTEAHYNLGTLLQLLGKTEEAEAAFLRVLALRPDFAEAHNNLGFVLQARGKSPEAIACYQKALALKPNLADAHNNLGNALQASGRLEEALTSFRRALELQPNYAEAHNNLGILHNELGEPDNAIAHYRRALELQPDFAEAHYNLGFLLSQLGQMEEAVTSFRKALALKPDYVQAYRGLLTIVKPTEAGDLITAMETLYYAKGGITDEDRSNLGFVLGKAYEELKEFDKSFAFIMEANRLKRRSLHYDTGIEQQFFNRIKQTFSEHFFASRQDVGFRDTTPIFIVGMPRSGTTLVEQILASHPLVCGAGELTLLIDLADRICTGATAAFPECMADLAPDDLSKMGSDYVEKLREYSQEARYITDKLPHNFLRVGLIKTILPDAKVIHCLRNPMDTCFSIYKNDFAETHGYAYDMEELGRYYLLYRDIMAHWEKILPGFMYNLVYEEMVTDQRKQTESLLDFCTLPWNDACLNFHTSKRKVTTASLAQVRKPVYRDSMELWKRFEQYLDPLRKVLND